MKFPTYPTRPVRSWNFPRIRLDQSDHEISQPPRQKVNYYLYMPPCKFLAMHRRPAYWSAYLERTVWLWRCYQPLMYICSTYIAGVRWKKVNIAITTQLKEACMQSDEHLPSSLWTKQLHFVYFFFGHIHRCGVFIQIPCFLPLPYGFTHSFLFLFFRTILKKSQLYSFSLTAGFVHSADESASCWKAVWGHMKLLSPLLPHTPKGFCCVLIQWPASGW